jgi:hypothetical protein
MHQQPAQSYPPQVPPQPWPQQGHANPSRRIRPARILFWLFAAVQAFTLLAVLGAGSQQTTGDTFYTLGCGAAVDVALCAGLWLWRQTGQRQ